MVNVDDINMLVELADNENNNGNNFEGFVVAQVLDDKVIGRVKIKSPKYVQLHHVATGDGVTNNLVGVLLNNEMDEFEVYLEKLPTEVKAEYTQLKKNYFSLIEYLYEMGNTYREKAKEIT